MLQDVLTHSKDSTILMSQIWKVFGVLLEYCSRGDFLSAISELEREKHAKIKQMESALSGKEK